VLAREQKGGRGEGVLDIHTHEMVLFYQKQGHIYVTSLWIEESLSSDSLYHLPFAHHDDTKKDTAARQIQAPMKWYSKMYMYACMHVYIFTRVHAYTHIYAHTHTVRVVLRNPQ